MAASTSGSETPAFHARYLMAVAGLIVAATWARQLFSGLWLDELGTAWVVKDGLGEAIDRAFTYHGQSPVYYVVAWAAGRLGGGSEVALRLPSVIAAALATWLLWRLVIKLVDREAARLAVVAFIALASVASAAVDARPYAMALALLVGAALSFVRWIEGGRPLDAVVFVALAAGTVYAHYLFGLALVPLVAFGLRRRDGGAGLFAQAIAWLAVGLLVAPLAAQLASLYSRRASLSIPYDGTVGDLLFFIVPPVLAGGVVLGALLARASDPITVGEQEGRPGALLLLGTWLVFPPTVLVLISVFGDANLFSARYYVSAAPAAAALFGWGVSRLQPEPVQRTVVVVTAVIAVLVGGSALRYGEDWRGAAEAERALAGPQTLVFLHPAFVESAQLDWLEDPEKVDYLLSPLDTYPMTGRIVPMPYLLDRPEVEDYLERVTEDQIEGVERFLLVTRYPWVPYREWWSGRLGDEGWSARSLGTFGVIEIIEFTKDEVEPPPA